MTCTHLDVQTGESLLHGVVVVCRVCSGGVVGYNDEVPTPQV